jgi:hypothetical protein
MEERTMRRTALACLTLAALAFGPSAADEAEFLNCGLCKPMMAEAGLMEHLHWESHAIATGMISVTRVDPSHEQAYQRAHVKVMDAVKRLQAGEKMELCPFCQSMNALAQAGAHIENLDAGGAHIMVITSDQPAVVEKIRAHMRWAQEVFERHDHGHEATGHAHQG